jgi:hypothetical protein
MRYLSPTMLPTAELRETTLRLHKTYQRWPA